MFSAFVFFLGGIMLEDAFTGSSTGAAPSENNSSLFAFVCRRNGATQHIELNTVYSNSCQVVCRSCYIQTRQISLIWDKASVFHDRKKKGFKKNNSLFILLIIGTDFPNPAIRNGLHRVAFRDTISKPFPMTKYNNVMRGH